MPLKVFLQKMPYFSAIFKQKYLSRDFQHIWKLTKEMAGEAFAPHVNRVQKKFSFISVLFCHHLNMYFVYNLLKCWIKPRTRFYFSILWKFSNLLNSDNQWWNSVWESLLACSLINGRRQICRQDRL